MDPTSNVNHSNSITRIGDDRYLISEHGKKTAIATAPLNLGRNPEIRAYILEQCTSHIPKKGEIESAPIKVGHRFFRWVYITPDEGQTILSRVTSAVNNFFFPPSEKGLRCYKLEEVTSKQSKTVTLSETIAVEETETSCMLAMLENSKGLDPKEAQQGIRAKVKILTEEELVKAPRFSDPYTSLASVAFQRYETDFTNKDKLVGTPSNCVMCIVKEGNHLKLQYKDKASAKDHAATIKHYYDSLVREYGEEKIAYINHLYSIKFSEMIKKGEPLTPEHVYRINMGLTMLESQDLQQTYERLKAFAEQSRFLDENDDLKEIFLSKSVVFEGDEAALSFHERKCLLDHLTSLKGKPPTIGDFLEWAKGINLNKPKFDQLSSKESEKIISLFSLKPEERDRALTGRAIFEPILGWYNSGELQEYKPWLDQQQLIQAFAEYENSKDIDAFYEILSFVIVKMHLLHEHPTEGYRIGALIPAQKDANGMQQWYKVTSCVSNGYGNFNYTLEGVGSDTTLPPIKLYRSTAASPYCMHGQASVRSDINPLNSPGYLGRHLSESYEEAFFHERSIPIWVGYSITAKDQLSMLSTDPNKQTKASLKALGDSLKHANTELELSVANQHRVQGMEKLLRKHDAILVDILSKEGRLAPTFHKDVHDLAQCDTLLNLLKENYLTSGKTFPLAEQKKDAETLILFLRKFSATGLKPYQHAALVDLLNDLETNILKDGKPIEKERTKAMTALKAEVFDELTSLEKEYSVSMEKGDLAQALIIAGKWVDKLDEHALRIHEHPSEKKKDGVVFLGHSLGGGLSQIHAHHYFMKSRRLPFHFLKMYAFDSPGINREDNEAFKTFGNKHAHLLKQLNIAIEVHHSQEAGDPVALGGEEHLGATFDPKEAAEVEKWLSFTGNVFERKKEAKTVSIAHSTTAHGTRFRLGAEKQDYIKTFYPSIFQGVLDRHGNLPKHAMQDIAQSVKSKLWRIDFFDSPTTEKIRSSVKGTILFSMMNSAEEKPRGEEFFDKRGVLAVNESGVLSAPKGKTPTKKHPSSSSQ